MNIILVCLSTQTIALPNANGQNWAHSGCNDVSKPICSSNSCKACISDCDTLQEVGGAPKKLFCHFGKDSSDGSSPTKGEGGCAVCKSDRIAIPSGVAHSGCAFALPICIVKDANTDGQCYSCNNNGMPGDDHDSCRLYSLGLCFLEQPNYGACTCDAGGDQSNDVENPDAGCPSLNPTCNSKDKKCQCGSSNNEICGIDQLCVFDIDSKEGSCDPNV